MRVEMAKILIAENDMILLDEPTNHLDLDSLRWLIKFLENYRGAIILVSHDRFFVNNHIHDPRYIDHGLSLHARLHRQEQIS